METDPPRLSFKLSVHDDHETVSDELEQILTDTEAPYSKRIRSASWVELKLLFHLAAPAVIVYLLNNVVSMSTQIFCGHLGNLELAAVSLGNNGIQMFAYGLMVIRPDLCLLFLIYFMDGHDHSLFFSSLSFVYSFPFYPFKL
jgi:MATE family multidrug resistance protein